MRNSKKTTVELIRCDWCLSSELYIRYHDQEWGIPKYDDHILFEMLILEGAQAGLSWLTILKKRENYHHAFHQFDPIKVAEMTEHDIERLMNEQNASQSIIRNRLKIKSAIRNALIFLKMQKEYGSFSDWLWAHVNHTPIVNSPVYLSDVTAKTDLSDQISLELKKHGMNFVGSTIIYAFLQAVGVVNDHLIACHAR